MLTRYDDFLCHQIPTTLDHVNTSAREWTERIIVHHHDTEGRLHLSAGFGLYPNRNIMDAFGCLVVDGQTQYNVRASRELRPLPDEVNVGPFSYEIIEPLKRVRSSLADNEFGLSYDVEFDATMPSIEEDQQFKRYNGRMIENVQRYDQAGKASGWVKIEGKTIKLDGQTFFAERDHSWGIRQGGGVAEEGVQPPEIPEGTMFSWGVFQFDSWGGAYHLREDWDGSLIFSTGAVSYPYGNQREQLRVRSIEHDFKFRPDFRRITGGRMVFNTADGSRKEIEVEPLDFCCLKGGGYFGYKGFVHGQWMGPSFIDGLKIDLTDPDALREVSFLDNTACRVRCGKEVGYGVFEVVVIGKYPKYGYQGW